jgi:hypothetical protein
MDGPTLNRTYFAMEYGDACISSSKRTRESPEMKHAAIGIRMHSGWGALVAVSNHAGTVQIIARQRIAITAPGSRGGNQPYHFAKDLELPGAEKFLEDCFVTSRGLAWAALRKLKGELLSQYRVVGSSILASHALIHAAEGEFFREAFSKACESLDLPLTGFREHDLEQCVRTTFGRGAARVLQNIASLGRSLGPPWTKDQKMATLAALMVLANSPR